MITRARAQTESGAIFASFTRTRSSFLQRKCACGGVPSLSGECEECRKEQIPLRRGSTDQGDFFTVPPTAQEVLRSPGQPLDSATRAFMEPRFGHDFSQVRVHTGTKAAESARAVNARAYTVGNHVVFGVDQHSPGTMPWRWLLAHELAHVVQQGIADTASVEPEPQVRVTAEGGYRIAVAPSVEEERGDLEHQADIAANRAVSFHGSVLDQASETRGRAPIAVQRVRVPLPSPVPLCGRNLTHIDVEPPRTRPLVPCPVPPITRVNIVGREVSSRSTGRGRIIFNLHIGFFRDRTTGRLCGIVDDSMTCVAPRCLILGCFPTLREVLDAILDFLKKALIVIGVILLAILLAIILRGLRLPAPETVPLEEPIGAIAGRTEEEAPEAEPELARA